MVLVNSSKFQLIVFLLFAGIILTGVQGQNVEKMMSKEVLALWKNAELISQIPLDTDVAATREEIHDGDILYKIRNVGEDSIIGYVLSTSAMGRFDAFDYFIVYDNELKVRTVRVTVYRSSHGSAICNKHWLKQFVGFYGETLVYGKDIQAVSGATISGISMVEDIQRVSRMMQILKEEQVI